MKLKSIFPTVVLILMLQQGFGQKKSGDSCQISIGTWFEPLCDVDTCTGPRQWGVTYSESCHIIEVLYKVYDPQNSKLIYKSDKPWDGKKNEPLDFYKAGYYPYEIVFYTSDKKQIRKKGKVFLHIW